ncbi:Carbohydrate-Binding Module Family 13 protein [Rhizophagus diaphanus]|nr:Carbohydrate-Binding Module Family 13 protein [Rhizophagus diaphanus] [Rhizophagus sp. MUCL 43196]
MALFVVLLKFSNVVDMQLWYFNGGFIVNKRSGFVLDVVEAKCQNGTKIVQYQKHDEPSRSQEWEYNYKDNSFYFKFNRNFVLDVSVCYLNCFS